jgi:hypothetical protein
MDKYNEQLNKPVLYLQQGEFVVCSILCGKTMESVLKDLLNKYLEEATHEEEQLVKRYLASLKRISISRLTVGEVVNFFERNNSLSSLARKHKVDVEEVRFLDLRKMVGIRNKAAHDQSDRDLEKADAHIMYGSLLRLIRIACKLLESQHSKQLPACKTAVEPEREAGRIIYSPTNKTLSPTQTQETITLYKNKSSGKHFVHLEDESSNKVLLVTPDLQMRALDSTLFIGPIVEEEDSAVKRGLITAEQVKRYYEYVDQQGGKRVIHQRKPNIKVEPNPTISHHTKGSRTARTGIRVTLPTGRIIHHPSAADTFTDVIEEMGFEAVRKLNLIVRGVPLVDIKQDRKYSQTKRDGYFIITHSSTEEKKDLLEQTSKRLGKPIKVEIV